MLDLRLAGLDLDKVGSLEESLLIDRMSEKVTVDFLGVVAIVQAIQEAAGAIVNGEGKFTKSAETIKKIQGILYPELGEEVEEKAKRSEELLQKEFDRGPLKVQRLDYSIDRRRKKRG